MGRPGTTGQLVQSIARKIAEGVWLAGRPIPPVRQLAISYGVARATMDAVVKGAVGEGLLVTEPRRAILVADSARQAATDLLERCRQADRAVRIAIITPAPAEADPAGDDDQIVRHVRQHAQKRQWAAEQVYWPIGRRGGFPRLLSDRNFDGAFCVVAQPERVMSLGYMRERGFPVVVYNRRFFDLPLPAVLLDSYGAVQRIGKMLHTLGHRKITLLIPAADLIGRFESPLVAGWLDFCRQYELLPQWHEPLQVVAHPDLRFALRCYLARRPLPTAVILGSSPLAEAFLGLADELRIRVPGDLSVAAACAVGQQGRQDIEPHMTCVRPNLDRVAECSIELLARMMAGEPYPPPIRLPHTIIRSDSIGPPRQS